MKPQRHRTERGSITAEFVLVLPVVFMILFIALSTMSMQLERMKLVSAASAIARAVARGEPDDKIASFRVGRHLDLKASEDLVCAELSAEYRLAHLFPVSVADSECARRLGF